MLIFLLRVAVSAGLLWLLARRFDAGRALEMASRASLPLLGAALAALVASVSVSVMRWQVILAAEGPTPSFGSLTKLVFVGVFFNQVLPTGIGGDAVRAWRIRRFGIALGRAARSVLLDRVCGCSIMIAMYGTSLPVLLQVLPEPRERTGIIAILVIALAGLLALPMMDFLPAQVVRLRGVSALADLSRETRRLIAQPARCAALLGLSLVSVGFAVLTVMLIGDSLGIALSFVTWCVVLPPVGLIQLLPVSLAGWGVREGAMVIILAGFGVPAAASLAISVLTGLALIILGLPGGLIWLADWGIPAATPAVAVGTTVKTEERRA